MIRRLVDLLGWPLVTTIAVAVAPIDGGRLLRACRPVDLPESEPEIVG